MFKLLTKLLGFIVHKPTEFDLALDRARKKRYTNRNSGGTKLKLVPKYEDAVCSRGKQ